MNRHLIRTAFFFTVFWACCVCWASPPDIAIHGFISQGYLQSNANNFYLMNTEDGTFEFNEMGLNFNSHVTEGLRVGLQLFARDFGDYGNDEIVVHWAYGDYYYKKWFGFRAGKMPITHGLYNDTRDIDILRVNILLPQSVYPEFFRDVFLGIKGIGCYGELPGGLSYQLAAGDMDLPPNSSFVNVFSGYFSTRFTSLDIRQYINGSLIWSTPLKNLRIGTTAILAELEGNGTAQPGARNDIDIDYEVLTFSADYTWRNLYLAAEYAQYRNNYTVSSTLPILSIRDDVLRTGGFYAALSYRFTDWLEAGAYYSELYYDLDERNHPVHYLYGRLENGFPTYLKETVLSIRFDLNESWLFKMETHAMRGYYLQGPGDDGRYDGNWLLYALKVTYNF